MKTLLSIFIIWGTTFCIAQNGNHTIGITPLGCYFNKGFFLTHGINYELGFKKNTVFASTEGSVFKSLDARKRYSSLDEQIPFLNQSVFVYGRELFTQQNKVHSNKFDVLIGYQFFQHGSQPEWDYWYVDSLENNGVSVLSGFQTHSALIGAKCSISTFRDSDKENRTPLARNTIEINYLFGFAIKLKGFEDYGEIQENTEIANTHKFNRSGIRCAYKYTRFITKHSSLYAQLDVLYVPFIEYTPNKNIYVQRGGERILPFFPSLKVGINIFKYP